MTAVNVVLRNEAAYVITDGEVRQGRQGGELTSRPKLLLLPHLNAVLALRGWPVMLGSLYTIVTHRRHFFNEAADELGADLRDAWSRCCRQCRSSSNPGPRKPS